MVNLIGKVSSVVCLVEIQTKAIRRFVITEKAPTTSRGQGDYDYDYDYYHNLPGRGLLRDYEPSDGPFKALMPTHLMLSLPMLSAKFFQAFLAL